MNAEEIAEAIKLADENAFGPPLTEEERRKVEAAVAAWAPGTRNELRRVAKAAVANSRGERS